jgi:hypothetical protein
VRLVVPNSPAISLFYNKVASAVAGGPAVLCGNTMPRPGGNIGATNVALIAAWINGGALP